MIISLAKKKATVFRTMSLDGGRDSFDSSFSMHSKKRHPKGYLFRCGRSDRSRIIDSQCEWGIRIVLFAKNDIPYRFLNAQTYRFDSSYQNKKIAVSTEVKTAILVGVTGVEPAASTSQMWRATSCATPRSIYFFVSLDSI